jgi:hypothetical protein
MIIYPTFVKKIEFYPRPMILVSRTVSLVKCLFFCTHVSVLGHEVYPLLGDWTDDGKACTQGKAQLILWKWERSTEVYFYNLVYTFQYYLSFIVFIFLNFPIILSFSHLPFPCPIFKTSFLSWCPLSFDKQLNCSTTIATIKLINVNLLHVCLQGG